MSDTNNTIITNNSLNDNYHQNQLAISAFPTVYYMYYNAKGTDEIVSETGYNNMLVAAKESATTTNNGNIPITNWRRSQPYITDAETPVENGAAMFEDIRWLWSEAEQKTVWLEDLDGTEDVVWDGSRITDDRITADNKVAHDFNKYLNFVWNSSNDYSFSGEGSRISAVYNPSNTNHPNAELYDSATWTHIGDDDDSWTLVRFQGEFVIDGDPSGKIYNLTSFFNGCLYTNDEIYVFIYPKGADINDTNMTQYLLFWGGTISDVTFHGVQKYQHAETNDSDIYRIIAHQYTMQMDKDNVGTLIRNNYPAGTDEQTYVLDIFVSDRSGGGGMYRPKLTKEENVYAETKVKVVSSTNNSIALSGGRFEMVGSIWKSTAISNDSGILTYKLNPTPDYTMSQVGSVAGYQNMNTPLVVDVNEDGSYLINETTYSSSNPYVIQLIPTQYTLTYDTSEAADVNITNPSIVYNIEDTLTLPYVDKSGYILKWLPISADGNWSIYGFDGGAILSNKWGNITLKAQWVPIKYETHYHSVLIPENEECEIVYNSHISTSKNSTQWLTSNLLRKEDCDDTTPLWLDLFPNYRFAGWESNPENDTDEVINLYAVWRHKTFRFIKLVMSEIASSTSAVVQFSEVEFLDKNGNIFVYPNETNVTATIEHANGTTTNPTPEAPSNLIDGNTSTKFCSVKWVPDSYVLFDFGESKYIDIDRYNTWRWYTANDTATNSGRNLKTFSLYGSNDGDAWELLDSVENYDAPAENYTLAYTGTITN